MKKKIGIIGATGYTGIELIKLLKKHPGVELTLLTSHSYVGQSLTTAVPEFTQEYAHYQLVEFDPSSESVKSLDAAFICLPHGHSMSMVPELLKKNIKVIDLGADFRYADIAIYEKIYQKHTAVELNAQAIYGLPEYNREQIRPANLIANPGCYVTAATLALNPLIESGNFIANSVIVDAKSGYSGAGRKFVEGLNLPADNLKFKAYKIGNHRHQSEIEQNLATDVLFTAHLLPLFRGILATCYVDLKEKSTLAEIKKLYTAKYQQEPFVRIVDGFPDIYDVINTNQCHISMTLTKNKKLVIVSVLDNLVKGASGQAVQNMNLLFGFEETAGLR